MKEDELHPLVSISNINPDDIPDVPTNKFLMRGGTDRKENNREERNNRDRRRERFGRRDWETGYRRDRGPAMTKSGRVIKGRGVFVSMIS